MSLNTFTKQAYEEFVVSGDFSNNLSTGELIASKTAEAIDKNGEDVSDSILDIDTLSSDGTGKVYVLVKGGSEDKSPYKITFKIITNATIPHKWEIDITMRIKEI